MVLANLLCSGSPRVRIRRNRCRRVRRRPSSGPLRPRPRRPKGALRTGLVMEECGAGSKTS
uniref:Uncharacterized protein n=1 Tax=Arundo donax TaxID=35708 RepID=A0A0A8YTJ9_ARUDO